MDLRAVRCQGNARNVDVSRKVLHTRAFNGEDSYFFTLLRRDYATLKWIVCLFKCICWPLFVLWFERFFLKMVLKLNRCKTKKIIPPDISPKVKHVICISRYYESHDVLRMLKFKCRYFWIKIHIIPGLCWWTSFILARGHKVTENIFYHADLSGLFSMVLLKPSRRCIQCC